MGTKNNPGKFDCYGNADPDEPMFILLARDIAAPAAILRWIECREEMIRSGEKPSSDRNMCEEARDCVNKMVAWRKANRPARG